MGISKFEGVVGISRFGGLGEFAGISGRKVARGSAIDDAEKAMLAGRKVALRGVESGDLEYLFRWENAPEMRLYGDRDGCGDGGGSGDEVGRGGRAEVPYSREVLREFIENQQYDIEVTGQRRFMIVLVEGAELGESVGMIDLYDVDLERHCAGVGVVVCREEDRGKGFGSEALELLCEYSERVLGMRSLYCCINVENFVSLKLFCGKKFVSDDFPCDGGECGESGRWMSGKSGHSEVSGRLGREEIILRRELYDCD